MKYLLPLTFILFLFNASCEDNKKTPAIKTETVSINLKDSLSKKEDNKKQMLSEAKKHPLITNENVVSFLTKYGKENSETQVRLFTKYGNIDLELFEDTPLHRANFIYLVKQGYFNDTYFHRIVPNFIIQAGNSDEAITNKKRAKLGQDYLLPAEIKHHHEYGTISGAKEYRENPDKKTAPYEFFIFLGPQTSTRHLEGNYTVFGKIIKGMDVVEKIANLPRDEGEWPLQNVRIKANVLH